MHLLKCVWNLMSKEGDQGLKGTLWTYHTYRPVGGVHKNYIRENGGKKTGHIAIRSLDFYVISSSWKYGLATCCLGHIDSRRYKLLLMAHILCEGQDDEYLTTHFACRSLTFSSHVTSLFWSLLIVSCFPWSINFGTLSFLGALASW